MTSNRIVEIIREEVRYQNNFILEGNGHGPNLGFRNNQLLIVESESVFGSWWTDNAPKIAKGLDFLGYAPGIGELFNAMSGVIKFSINDLIGGAISTIASIPFVGKFLGAPFRLIHSVIGKHVKGGIGLLTKAFNFLKNGKMGEAATKLLEALGKLATSAGGNIKTKIDGIYKFIRTSASKINQGIDSIIPGLESLIRKVSFGIIDGLPVTFKNVLSKFFNQFKEFFTGLGKGKLYQTTKNVTKKTVTTKLTKKEEETYRQAYADNPQVKVDYPTLDAFIKSQIELKKKKQTQELKLWSSGPLVEKLQKALGIKVDGKFGEGTELAVKKYQKKNGLTPDGVVGPETWKKLT